MNSFVGLFIALFLIASTAAYAQWSPRGNQAPNQRASDGQCESLRGEIEDLGDNLTEMCAESAAILRGCGRDYKNMKNRFEALRSRFISMGCDPYDSMYVRGLPECSC